MPWKCVYITVKNTYNNRVSESFKEFQKKNSVFLSKKANFGLKIEYHAESYPKISGFLSFWAKNP